MGGVSSATHPVGFSGWETSPQGGASHMAAYISPNGNGNGSINGRGIKHRDFAHPQLVELAADAVSGVQPVVPSLSQAPKIFEGVTQGEVSEELKRREVV